MIKNEEADIPDNVSDDIFDKEDDITLEAFLAYLDMQLALHPELITPADLQQLDRIATLVEGVE